MGIGLLLKCFRRECLVFFSFFNTFHINLVLIIDIYAKIIDTFKFVLYLRRYGKNFQIFSKSIQEGKKKCRLSAFYKTYDIEISGKLQLLSNDSYMMITEEKRNIQNIKCLFTELEGNLDICFCSFRR